MKIKVSSIKEFFNCREASIDKEGDIWISDPQTGHWIGPDEKNKLMAWLTANGNHGGSRPGAGRPTTGRKQAKFFLNDQEKELVKKYIDGIRGGK